MKNKKGFTLIELLAVIVILAIIMVIAVPKILEVIENARMNAFKDSAGLMANSAQLKFTETNVLGNANGEVTYVFENGEYTSSNTLNFKGDKPDNGIIKVNSKGRVALALISKDGKYCATKTYTSKNVSVKLATDGECKVDDEISAGTTDSTDVPKACINNLNQTVSSDKVCKRAESLHSDTCAAACTNIMNPGDEIVYGSCGTIGSFSSGDAFDCDVDGSGTFDLDERFYYVTDLSTDSSYAVLIYYDNVSAGVNSTTATYAYNANSVDGLMSGIGNTLDGPATAILQLPTTTQWTNVSLSNTERSLYNELGTLTTIDHSTGNSTEAVNPFSYSGYAARLLTMQEINSSFDITTGTQTGGELDKYNYLFENTVYSNSNNGNIFGFLLENIKSDYSHGWFVNAAERKVGTCNANNAMFAVRPVIEVPKSKIQF